jgi:hypothetical protein
MTKPKIKHKCKRCAGISKEYAELSKICAKWSKEYVEKSKKKYAKLSKEYANKCQCRGK